MGGKLIFLSYLLILLMILPFIESKSTFKSLDDIVENATYGIIIINLTNSSQTQLNQLYNISEGYKIHF